MKRTYANDSVSKCILCTIQYGHCTYYNAMMLQCNILNKSLKSSCNVEWVIPPLIEMNNLRTEKYGIFPLDTQENSFSAKQESFSCNPCVSAQLPVYLLRCSEIYPLYIPKFST